MSKKTNIPVKEIRELFPKMIYIIEELTNEIESWRESGDCGYWEWEEGDIYLRAINLLNEIKQKNQNQ